jgi:beta-galactosidase
VARTYINKTLLGEHRGGFTAFCYELTDYLHYGEPNELRVLVDNTHREDLPPLSGDFNLDGGLYRDVELIVTDLFCISPLDYASPGVYITPRSINGNSASVAIRTMVSNGNKTKTNLAKAKADAAVAKPVAGAPDPNPPKENPEPSSITVQTEVRDASGAVVAKSHCEQTVPPEETISSETVLSVPSPHLWSGRQDPYLYSVKVTLLQDGRTVDTLAQPLGLRTVAITQDQGFLLNGTPYPVHGVNRHQDVRGRPRAAALPRFLRAPGHRHTQQRGAWRCRRIPARLRPFCFPWAQTRSLPRGSDRMPRGETNLIPYLKRY